MKNTVETKELRNGNKLVVVNIDGKLEYAPKYVDLKRLIAHLGAIYGKEEVTRELGLGDTSSFPEKSPEKEKSKPKPELKPKPNWRSNWRYKFLGRIYADSYQIKTLRKLVDKDGNTDASFIELDYGNDVFRLCFHITNERNYLCTKKLNKEVYIGLLKELNIYD